MPPIHTPSLRPILESCNVVTAIEPLLVT